jgi:hypothetical protein
MSDDLIEKIDALLGAGRPPANTSPEEIAEWLAY